MKKHFVEFLSSGTFVSEVSINPVDDWDVEKAVEMSKSVKERYGATPYGFRFITRERGDDDLDSKVTDSSGIYYLGGKIKTLEDVESEEDQRNEVLISNMRMNKIDRVIVNDNSYLVTMPFGDQDVLLTN